jgi:hypothetical protein
MKKQIIITLIGSSGLAFASDVPTNTDLSQAQLRHAGHMYFNVATGEQLLTRIDVETQSAVSGDSEPIWVVSGPATGCDSAGSTSTFFILDNDTGFSSGPISPALFDWGDIEPDTVVDCIQIHWITDHADTDTNSDGFADAAIGFGATWTFWDGMNGRAPQMFSTALPILELTFQLPGEYPSDTATIAYYTADVDLAGSFGSPLNFEIGDTDSDPQGAALFNPRMDLQDNDSDSIPDLDIDQDSLADWGWSIDYHQPGTYDFDNADGDSDPMTGQDGDLEDFAIAGVNLGLPQPGNAVFDTETETWSWVTEPGAAMVEDLYSIFDDDSGFFGTFWFAGFSCDPYQPYAAFQMILYQAQNGCSADLNDDGDLNFLDVSFFINEQIDYNEDMSFNFLDVSQFLADYATGCP